MVYKCKGLQAHFSCTTETAQTQLRSNTTNTLIAFIPTVTQQGDKSFKRTPPSQLLAILRKQGKLILSRTEVSSEGVYISIFHLDQGCLFEDHLPVASTQSAVAHTVEQYWGPGTGLLDKTKQEHTLINIQLTRNEACRARLQPAQSRTFWTAGGPWHHMFFSTDPLLLAHFR